MKELKNISLIFILLFFISIGLYSLSDEGGEAQKLHQSAAKVQKTADYRFEIGEGTDESGYKIEYYIIQEKEELTKDKKSKIKYIDPFNNLKEKYKVFEHFGILDPQENYEEYKNKVKKLYLADKYYKVYKVNNTIKFVKEIVKDDNTNRFYPVYIRYLNEDGTIKSEENYEIGNIYPNIIREYEYDEHQRVVKELFYVYNPIKNLLHEYWKYKYFSKSSNNKSYQKIHYDVVKVRPEELEKEEFKNGENKEVEEIKEEIKEDKKASSKETDKKKKEKVTTNEKATAMFPAGFATTAVGEDAKTFEEKVKEIQPEVEKKLKKLPEKKRIKIANEIVELSEKIKSYKDFEKIKTDFLKIFNLYRKIGVNAKKVAKLEKLIKDLAQGSKDLEEEVSKDSEKEKSSTATVKYFGIPIECFNYDENGKLSYYWKWKYSFSNPKEKKNNVKQFFNEEGVLIEYHTYEFEGDEEIVTRYNRNNIALEKAVFDSDGKLIKKTTLKKDNYLFREELTEMAAPSDLIIIEEYEEDKEDKEEAKELEKDSKEADTTSKSKKDDSKKDKKNKKDKEKGNDGDIESIVGDVKDLNLED